MEDVRKVEPGEKVKYYSNYNNEVNEDASNDERYVDSNGFLHNINDLPAIIGYFDDGNKSAEFWSKHGRDHRLTGPAYISYNLDGKILHKEYWIDGNRIHSKEEFETEVNRLQMLNEINKYINKLGKLK